MNSELARLFREWRAGRVLSAANEKKLRQAIEALNDVLAQLGLEEDSRGDLLDMEQRYAAIDAVEIRQTEDGRQIISGHAAVFDQLSVPLWGFRERIKPGAFKKSLESSDIRALYQHNAERVLGRTKNGTLQLEEDARGLAFELEPPDTADGRDAVTLIERGDIDQMSFGFRVLPGGESWIDDEEMGVIRELVDVNLIEISPVTWAAYPQTDVDVVLRSAPDWVQRALAQGVDDMTDEQARARLNLMSKALDLLAV